MAIIRKRHRNLFYKYFVSIDGANYGLKEVLRRYSFIYQDGEDEVLVVEVKDILRWSFIYHTRAEKKKLFNYIVQDAERKYSCKNCGRYQPGFESPICHRCFYSEINMDNYWIPMGGEKPVHAEGKKESRAQLLRSIKHYISTGQAAPWEKEIIV